MLRRLMGDRRARRESEARYDVAMRAINEGVYDWNVADGTIFYSEAVYRVLGMPRSMRTPADWAERIHPEDRAKYNAAIASHFKGETERFECEYRYRGPDHSWRWARQHGLAIRNAQGRAVRMVGSTGDITEQRSAEQALAEERQRLALVVRAAQAGIIDWDTGTESPWYSERFKEMLGYPPDADTSAWASIFGSLMHPEDRDRSRDVFFTGLVRKGPPNGVTVQDPLELRLRRADGSWLWVESHGLTLHDEAGEAKRYLAAVTDISGRRAQEEALRNQFKYINDLLDSVPVAVAMRDTEGKYLLVNRRWEEYFDVPRDEVVGRSLRERASARMADAVLALDRAVLERGAGALLQEDDFEYRGRKFSQTRSVMADAEGRVLGVLVASIETTERAAMDARLRAQIALTQAIVTQAPNSIFAKDREGRFTLANRGWSEMSGIPAEKAIGRTVHDLYPAEVARRFAEEDAKLLAQGTAAPPIEQLHAGPRPDQYRIVRKAVLSRDSEVLGLVCSSTDVSELKRMERELGMERDRLELLVRSTKAGFLDWDPITDTRVYSARFKEMLGYPADTDTSQWPSLLEMVHPEDRAATREAFRTMLRSGAATGERMHGPLECRLRKTDGSYLWVRGEGIAQINAAGRTERFLASYIDITQLRELNLALEESVRLREEVDRISRHDLKTPLNSIVGIPRVLRDSGRLSAEDGELLAFVEQAGYRLLNMVNLSLDMFQMERGTYPFTPKPVDLRDVLGKVARDLERHASAKRVRFDIEGPRLYALAEELLCYSMFANLAKNALEASPEGGTVGIAITDGADGVQVRVHNAGAVPEAVRARFFAKYSSAGKQGGSGLGTYSARLMAHTQKGDIEMQTGDTGTTLSVRLMRAAPDAEASKSKSERTEQNPPTELRPLSVLVVDDDEYTRVFVQRFLPATMRTRTAVNGREALDCVRQEPPDAIVMDLDMPVMGGLEAARRIRQAEAEAGRARCAMIAMSSHDDPAIAARCEQAGFDRYLAKPVSPDVLRRALAELHAAPAAEFVDPDLRDKLPGFLASRRELADELAQAVAAGSAEPARALAHKLAGSLTLYGFHAAAALSKTIEVRARENRLEGLAGDVAALRRQLDGMQTRFEAKGTAEAQP